MRLTREEIESVARLSRLELSDAEKDTLAGHINRLLENFERLKDLDTENVQPTSHVIPVSNVLRDDVSRPSLPVEDVVSNGPQVADGCFVVPRVVDV